MKGLVMISTLFVTLLALPAGGWAHCDAIDGPVATAALEALETRNVNLILPYVPAEAEPELVAAFEQVVRVRATGPEARTLAERYFMETAVRLHRLGEKASYTGLKPAGTDFGPAIPAAERALETARVDGLVAFVSQEVARAITERFRHVTARQAASKAPETSAGVPAARERVSAELEFIGYVEQLYRATRGGAHAE